MSSTIAATNFNVINGGVLTANFYIITVAGLQYLNSTATTFSNADVSTYLIPVGAITFFKKPSLVLKPVITTEK